MYRNNDIIEERIERNWGKAMDYREFIQLDLPIAVAIVSCGADWRVEEANAEFADVFAVLCNAGDCIVVRFDVGFAVYIIIEIKI